MRKFFMLAIFLLTSTICIRDMQAQGNPPPYLMYTLVNGVLTPASGSGPVLPSNPPPILCYGLNGSGQAAPCVFSGGGGGSGTVTSVSGLSPLFTVSNPTTTPTFALESAPANSVFGNFTGALHAPSYSNAPVFSAANLTNFPILNQNTTGTASNVTGVVAVANGGTGTNNPSLVPGTNITISGTWPNQTINSSGGGITTLTGDVTASGSGSVASTVKGINGVLLSGLSNGLLKNTTSTGVPSIAIAGTDYLTPTGNGSGLTALNASNLASGTVGVGRLPVATTSALGVVEPDGTTITITGGVISAVGGGSGNTTSTSLTSGTLPLANGANSIVNSLFRDNGTNGSYNGTGGFSAPIIGTTGSTSLTTCGSATGCVAFNESSTSGTPTIGQAYIRADSTTNELLYSINGSAEANLVGSGSGITTLTGDVSASGSGSVSSTVKGINGISLSGLATGILKNTTSTGVPSIASVLTDYQANLKVFYADTYTSLVGTSACTIGGVTYGTAADCAYGAALNYVTATSSGAIVRVGYGIYEQQIPWLLPCIIGSGILQQNTISVRGEGSSVSILQAQTGFTFANPMIYRTTTCATNNNYNQVRDITLDGNYVAPGIMSMQLTSNMYLDDITGVHSATATSAFDIASADNGSISGSIVHNVNYVGTQGHGGRAADIQATITSGAISGFTIGNITSSIAVTAAGSGGTPGTYTWTTTSCSGTGLPGATDPSGTFVVGSGGTITSASLSSTAVGYMCPSTITVSTSAATGLTGATLTVTMVVGGTAYGQGTPGFTKGIYYGHAAGGSLCTTMPTNAPVLTFNGSGVLTSVALVDGTVASTGSGCTPPGFVWIYSGDPIQYAFSVGAVDLQYDGMIANGGWGACFNITEGGGIYNFMHPFDVCPIGARVTAGSNLFNTKCDSLASGCIDITNGTSTIVGTQVLFDTKASYAGSSKIIYDSNSSTHAGGGQVAIGGTCLSANFVPSLFNDVIGATGPVSLVQGTTLAGSFPASQMYLDGTCASVANKYDAKINLTTETAIGFIGPVAGDEGISCTATPTFSSSVNVSRCVVSTNITSFTLAAGTVGAGQSKTLCFRQGSGPFTVTPPANVVNFIPIGNVNGTWYCQNFSWNAANSLWMGSGNSSTALIVTTPSIGGSLISLGCANQSTVTVTGASTSMGCVMSGTAGNPANIQPQCSVTSANTVTPQLCTSIAAGVTPTAQTYNIRVIP